MNSFDIKFNTLNKEELFSYLKIISPEFNPSLDQQVINLKEYSNKIFNNAYLIEAYYKNKLVGLLAIYLNSNNAYITHLSVLKQFQNQKLGSLLIEKSIELAKDKGFKNIVLECHKINTRGLSFYKKNGFDIEQENASKFILKHYFYKASIICVAYNHAKYIKETLEGFLMQKTNFPFEVLIHDDASTDGTAEIIKEYEKKYPDIIKPIYQKNNQFSKGIAISKTFNFPRVKGKYVAFCEGDDYWTDENKLQKQVDFMDANPDYTICFHNVNRKFEITGYENDIYPDENTLKRIKNFDYKNLLICNFIPTNSVMYRWETIENVQKQIPDDILPGDWYLHLMFAKKGKIKHFKEAMSVYRVNSGGIWYNSYNNLEIHRLKTYPKYLNFLNAVCKNIENNSDQYKDKFLHELETILEILRKHKKNKEIFILKLKYWNYKAFRSVNYYKAYARALKFMFKFY